MRYIPSLTIAGSDSSGGAGIQADLKTMSALGCYAMSVVTAVTAQNTCGVRAATPISTDMIRAQIDAVLEDIPPKAIKIGMLFDADIITAVADALQDCDVPIVLDPVMVATSGDRLLDNGAVEALILRLVPLATLITPNLLEAEVLYGAKISSHSDIQKAGEQLLSHGCQAVLIKGGHTLDKEATDYLFTREGQATFTKPRLSSRNTHGTGCTLSSAITAYLAQGEKLHTAIAKAKEYLYQAIKSGELMEIGHGHGPVDHFYSPLPSIKR